MPQQSIPPPQIPIPQLQPQPQPQRVQQPAQPVQTQHPARRTSGNAPYVAAAHPRSSVQVRIPQPGPVQVPTDHVALFISLGEEYVAAARSMGSTTATTQDEAHRAQYYKLMATGLGCMDNALRLFKKYPAPWNLPNKDAWNPRMEHVLTLRYCSLLYEETDNDEITEELLGKAIPNCERLRHRDLAYSMQHLLARLTFKNQPRAALKMLEDMIRHTETYTHQSWSYSYRFLRASMLLKLGTQADKQAALRDLGWISAYSRKARDRALHVWISALEAMVHLLIGQSDSLEKAQRSIASARSFQFSLQGQDVTPVIALLDLVDLSCNLLQYQSQEAISKMQNLQAIMDDEVNPKQNLPDDATFTILIESGDPKIQGDLTTQTLGLFEKHPDGRDKIVMAWMHRRDIYSLAYYISGVTYSLKNPLDEKGQSFLLEGLKMVREILKKSVAHPASLTRTEERLSWVRFLEACILIDLTFFACNKGNWLLARKRCDTLQSGLTWTPETPAEETDLLGWFAMYLNGVIEQGMGNTEKALQHYRPIIDSAPRDKDSTAQLAALATMNTLLIIRDPSHIMNVQYDQLLSQIEQFCSTHANKSIQSAFCLLKSLGNGPGTGGTVIKMKQFIQQAINAAKAVPNTQLLYMSMNFMTAMFFTNIMGEQAQKSAQAGRSLAKRGESGLWLSVADGMMAQMLETHGNAPSAQMHRQEAEALRNTLPHPLR
ncbi:hypothetical protein K490DRAFT_45695 [Saccharata proteae CBS 121410]|uniref:Cohesin loading factor n=1 Tax=Saccharata proteae CBS 121410 TaxID=1314787 RepID=A0A9P4HQ12_9PEZI|nr:hypothetical protein K490DRAFT_45695 [Saccharata proteae CBS 121410]